MAGSNNFAEPTDGGILMILKLIFVHDHWHSVTSCEHYSNDKYWDFERRGQFPALRYNCVLHMIQLVGKQDKPQIIGLCIKTANQITPWTQTLA